MIKEYDLIILYHPGMENVVADALSRTGVLKTSMPLIFDLDHMGIFLFYASVAYEETRLFFQSPLHEPMPVA